MQEHKHENVNGECKHCGIKMVAHQTFDEWQAVVDKNRKEREARKAAGEFKIPKTPDNPHGVAIGAKLDPNDKRPDAPRRYFKRASE